jgi:hypothetical protein
MRVAIIAASLAGCGRVAFDPLPVVDDACAVLGSWQRQADFVPGSVAGTSAGNPTGPWSYERTPTAGSPLGTATPWYVQSTTLLVWDDDWFGGGMPCWAGGNDIDPPVDQTDLIHEVRTDIFDAVPIVRWRNPFATTIELDVDGSLSVLYDGTTDAAQIDVDVVIAALDPANADLGALYATTVHKPTADMSRESVDLTVPAASASLAPGSSIVITLRGRTSVSGDNWMTLTDHLQLIARGCP